MSKPYPKPPPRRKSPKKRPKSERQILEDYLDDLVREIVKLRDKQVCVLCNSPLKPQTGHLFVRDRMGTRWDLSNVHCQCASCNLYHRFDQAPYIHWFKRKYGESAYNDLYEKAESRPYYKWSVPELYAAISPLEGMLRALAEPLPEERRDLVEAHIIERPYEDYLRRFHRIKPSIDGT